MGCRELIDALRKGAGEKNRILWEEAEREAGLIRKEYAGRIAGIREECLSRRKTFKSETGRTVSAANAKARMLLLSAEQALSKRLFGIASSSLASLRNDGAYPKTFEALVRELPPLVWQKITVNPSDIPIAEEFFPAAEVLPDKGIFGGLIAVAEGGRITVVNTFEKRLERAWSEIVPALIKDVCEAQRSQQTDVTEIVPESAKDVSSAVLSHEAHTGS